VTPLPTICETMSDDFKPDPQMDGSFAPHGGLTESIMSNNSSLLSLTDDEKTCSEHSQPQQPPHHSDDDDEYNAEDRPYNGVFEGPEKTLEVCFRIREGVDPASMVGADGSVGLRRLPRADIDAVCRRARCTILSSISNAYLDAYVLSESSLFVYPYMVMIKTCGTTTLLRCIAILVSLGKKLGLEIDWVGYSRKNFNFPDDQLFPHGSFHQELDYLASHRSLSERLSGNGYTLGPVTSDHWFVFVADKTIRGKNLDADTDRVLNVMMFDIDMNVANKFYYEQYQNQKAEQQQLGDILLDDEETKKIETARVSDEMTKAAGIDKLVPGSVIDSRAFEPCGYSMNAILFRSYATMHITPEEGSSYASFETNQKVSSYASLINNVVRTFRPKRFVMTLMADEGGLGELKENPFMGSGKGIVVPAGKDKIIYKRSNVASIQVEQDTCCLMGNWVADDEVWHQAVTNDAKARSLSFGS
jgi:S-adenosylmethionine decarboxylase